MGQESKKDNGAQNKPATEKVEMAKLAPLPASATGRERKDYIKALHASLLLCKGRHLECAWYIGRELPRLKAMLRFEGRIWKTFCEEAFDIGDRQARSYIKIAETFPTNADLKELLNEADSIRQAVELAKIKKQEKEALNRPKTTCLDGEPSNSDSEGESPRNPMLAGRNGASKTVTPLPFADATRAELQDASDTLRKIAETDDAAFKRVLKLIQKAYRGIKSKTGK